MNEPISYLQTDKRWSNVDYSAKGEKTTIGKAGCGPTCMAMVIASLKDPSVTPVTTAKWSLSKNYKACKQGTYYSYFKAQGEAYGITLTMLNSSNIYKSSSSSAKLVREKIIAALNAGKWVIACMGKGTWTSSGHYVLAYGITYDGRTILINDPNSTEYKRTNGDKWTWLNEIKFAWIVENKKKDDGVIEKIKILIDGEEVFVDSILKNNENYVRLRDFDDKLKLFKISYDEDEEIPILTIITK